MTNSIDRFSSGASAFEDAGVIEITELHSLIQILASDPASPNGTVPGRMLEPLRVHPGEAELSRTSPMGDGSHLVGEGQPGDWSSTLDLVEQAAATIKSYEERFRQLEADARAFLQRMDEEQLRLHTYIVSLESSLEKAEGRAAKAETAMQEAELRTWEASVRRKKAEIRAADAEVKVQRSEAYLRRVHDILVGI